MYMTTAIIGMFFALICNITNLAHRRPAILMQHLFSDHAASGA